MSVTPLPFVYCLLLEFSPELSQAVTDCDSCYSGIKACDNFANNVTSANSTWGQSKSHLNSTDGLEVLEYEPPNCFTCRQKIKFLFGGSLEDPSSPGNIASVVLLICIILVGIFGTLGNALIMTVVRSRKRASSFDSLLYILAAVDLLNCFTSILVATGIIIYFQNWDRGLYALILYFSSLGIFLAGKSISAYLTVLITVERYIIIADPIRSRYLFTVNKTRRMAYSIIFAVALLHVSRSICIRIGSTDGLQNVPSLVGRDFLIYSTPVEHFWITYLASIDLVLDNLLPYPLLLVFNALIFVKIGEIVRTHQQLTKTQSGDIRAARMFIPVVVMLFFCNIEPIGFFIVVKSQGVLYRELMLGLLLSVVFNSAVNLPIYYSKGSSFKERVHNCLPEWLKPVFGISRTLRKDNSVTSTGTTTWTDTSVSDVSVTDTKVSNGMRASNGTNGSETTGV